MHTGMNVRSDPTGMSSTHAKRKPVLMRCHARERGTLRVTANLDISGRVLVLNAGSSSLKFKTFEILHGSSSLTAGLSGVLERIGDETNSCLLAKGVVDTSGHAQKWNLKTPAADHVTAMLTIMDFLESNVSAHISDEVHAVGHRIVHGMHISRPTLLTGPVIETIREAAVFAPLHNTAGLQGIRAAQEVFSHVPQVAVFDTAFHQTMPAHSYMYGLPYEMYEQHAIRRYGFHGTSHSYLVAEAAKMLGKLVEETNVITCHLGNGCSVTAVENGKSVDTSMGMTPLEGLLMGTRSGDIDPAVVLHLQTELSLSVKEMDTLLNKKSGLLGLCGQSDLRSVVEMSQREEARGTLALNMFVYRIRKYIGAYIAALGGRVDAVVFSAGIGENSPLVRGRVCEGLQLMGIEVNEALNQAAVGGQRGDVSARGAKIRVLVIPTDEELCIAQQTLEVARASG